jgi:hypothetical protein
VTAKAVARVGDVVTNADTPRPGTWPVPATATGSWKAGPVRYTPDPAIPGPKVTAGGKVVVVKAECDFTFTGADNTSGATVTATSTLTLEPGSRALGVGNATPLVQGDTTKPDGFGNTLTVVSTATWRTE